MMMKLATLPLILLVTILSVPLTAPAQSTEDPTGDFGAALTLSQDSAVSVSTAIASPELHSRPVLVLGSIADVCQKKGCWMVVSDGQAQMRVTFKDYGFFVPMNSSGQQVLIEGVVSEQEISEELAKHYAEESRSENPEDIQGPQKVITMVASAVRIIDAE
jgi:hypothetical protein